MSIGNTTQESSQTELSLRIKNLMRLFLDSIRDYEHESGHSIYQDERQSLEFVDIFLESEDAFDYAEIIKLNQKK